MTTPGGGDPYWYEWYVGLEQLIRMINPDNEITYVVFQSDVHITIDDVVVGYGDKKEICYQVKHEVGDSGKGNLTFSKLIETTTRASGSTKMSLIRALALGWEEAKKRDEKVITPILYTNRNLGKNKTTREFEGENYKALPLDQFVEKIQSYIKKSPSVESIESLIEDKDLMNQWRELKGAIGNDSIVFDFLKAIQIRANEGSLENLEDSMIQSLQDTFKCNQIVAKGLFDKLCSSLRIWTTTRRGKSSKVEIEDVFDALSINNDKEHGEHELPYPMPFFESRQKFAEDLIIDIKEKNQKVIWISGEPGSGKTSLISYLQLNYNFFSARYHTFKPISPIQRFYNSDTGLCKQESLWNDLLIQLRRKFRGELNKYGIPITNALCTVEQMRNEVLRLAKILNKKTKQKTIICIDGIDHAARANNEITFLGSLFSPEEIPEGVVFVIVGQPAQFYEQYPLWIKTQTEYVEHLQMPSLLKKDIRELLSQQVIDIDIEVLVEFIFDKTSGNNLSVVFSVEEAKQCKNIEDLKRILDSKYVSADITNYYSHIWRYVSEYLNQKGLGISFPDKVIASVIILLNGRLNTEMLSKAVKINLMKEDWDEVLELLYPLVQKIPNENEYTLFHNDFRVFLIANNSESAKYKSIAFQLANYYMENEYNLESLTNLIPLLISADKKELISKFFNGNYIISSLAHGISLRNLQDYAKLAYQSALESKDWKQYHSVYFAINTLHQHHRYYEYYEKEYKIQDKTYAKMLNKFELRVEVLNTINIGIYLDMINFCLDLLSYGDSISILRARSTYMLWMKDLSPCSFINTIISKEDNTIYDQNMTDEILKKWGRLAAIFGEEFVVVGDSEYSDEVIRAILIFNDTYFEYLLKENKSEKALEVVHNGGVSYSCIEKNVLEILYKNQIDKYYDILERITTGREISNDTLLANVCLIYEKKKISDIELDKIEKITYITSETSLRAILLSIIIGFQYTNKDFLIGLNVVNGFINKIERHDKDFLYLKSLVKNGFVIGRTIGELNSGLVDGKTSYGLPSTYKDLFTYKTAGVRTYNFHEGFKVLLFLSLNQNDLLKQVDNEFISELLEIHLFERSQLGMHYKTHILDFLVKNQKENILNKYLIELYGENGKKLFLESNYEETHEIFKKYGKLTIPELMDEIDEKLKWDVVSYVDHKEYALWPLLNHFKTIGKQEPGEWKTRGLDLYKLSTLVSIKGSNRASSEIQREIGTAAINSGIQDVWLLREQDEEFRFSLDILYSQLFVLIEVAKDIEEIVSIWIFSCGVLSWYHKDDREGLKNIYNKCVEKGKEIGNIEIESLLVTLTPEHSKIAIHKRSNEYSESQQNEFTLKRKLEETELQIVLSEIDTREIVEFLKYEQNLIMRWTSVNIAWDIIDSRNEISNDIAKEFSQIVLKRLEDYSWNNSGCEKVIEKILNVLEIDFLWELAEYNSKNINQPDNYYTFSSNMEFILKYAGNSHSLEFTKTMFDEELNGHYGWITGNGHLKFEFEISPSKSNLIRPKNIHEFIFNVLMEQISTRNIHRIEVSLQGLMIFVKKYPEMFIFISDSWESYNIYQKEYLIKLSERWARENTQNFNTIFPHILKEYEITNELDKKFQLFTIIKTYEYFLTNKKERQIEYSAKEIEYNLPKQYPPIFDKSKITFATKNFLRIMERLTMETQDDLAYYIQNEKLIKKDETLKNTSRPGDSMLYLRSYTDLEMQVLYGEEKKNRWDYIPLAIKAQFLLQTDDAWIFTNVPKVSFEKEWHIEEELKSHFEEKSLLKCKPYLKILLEKDVPENMYMIGGGIWYPIGSKDGIVYTESSKLIQNDVLVKNLDISSSLHPSIIASNLLEEDEDIFIISEEYLDENGVCLTNEIVGTSVFIYGNTLVYPSLFLKEALNLHPSKENPLVWLDNKDNVIMYFERFVSPFRETIQENYFRQPLMGRWLCKKTVIDELVEEGSFTFYKADKIEKMPELG